MKGTVYKATVKQFEGRRRRVLATVRLPPSDHRVQQILPEEIRKLAVLRHIASKMAETNKWWPIFERWLGIIGDRVRGLGGDPYSVEPSSNRQPAAPPARRRPRYPASFTGKVEALYYDCSATSPVFSSSPATRALASRPASRASSASSAPPATIATRSR